LKFEMLLNISEILAYGDEAVDILNIFINYFNKNFI